MIKNIIKPRTPLAWRQLIKAKGRFLVALSGIAFADLLMLMQIGFQSALLDSNTRLPTLLKTDLVMLSSQAQNIALANSFSRRRLFQANNLPEVESVSPLYIRLGNWKNPQTKLESSILIIGFNPTSSAFNLPEVKQNLDLIKYPDTLLFDRSSRGKYQEVVAQIAGGKPVTTELQGRRITISGLYKIGSSFIADGSLITSDQNFLRIFSGVQAGQVSIGLITLKPDSDANVAATKLNSLLPEDVKVFTREQYIAFEKNYWERSTTIGFIFGLGVIMGFLVGVIIVYQILYSDVADHLPEYATLKAMGYSDIYLLNVVFQEAILLAILGYIPGFIISNFLYELTRNATNLPLFMTVDKFLLVLILTVIMCIISGGIAMQKLRSADPADIF
ncbi:MAG: ABC transporter permease DevC [Scytonematopsis contorta HA4267-MV1]|jgi:putative ABC transport system permease protein|nr:ABC transporter permease DevC [Scytonematopsis contorta HA4267-MV1]